MQIDWVMLSDGATVNLIKTIQPANLSLNCDKVAVIETINLVADHLVLPI